MTMRDFKTKPYDKSEERVAEFFAARGVGGGDDPIGFLLTSYEYLVRERNQLQKELHQMQVFVGR